MVSVGETGAVQLRFLGTGSPDLDPRRCGSGTAIELHGSSAWLLVDCGRGVTQRAIEAGLDPLALEAVLLTHHHSDHVSDLAGLAIARFIAGAERPLQIIAPEGPCQRFAGACLDAFDDTAFYSQRFAGRSIRPAIEVTAFPATSTPRTVAERSEFEVAAALVDHGPMEAAVGYRVAADGAVVAISGDTAVGPGIRSLSASVDVPVHQALRSDLVTSAALTWNASARSVGSLAHEMGVGHLVLTHLMPSPAGLDDEAAFEFEARSGGYCGPVTIAQDLGRLLVP